MTRTKTQKAGFSISALAGNFNRFNLFTQARKKSPIWQDDRGAWHVMRYEDCRHILEDPKTFTSDILKIVPDFYSRYKVRVRPSPFNVSPKAHKRIRTLTSSAVTPTRIFSLQTALRTRVSFLIDRLSQRRKIEVVKQLAEPMTLFTASRFLGIPLSDAQKLRPSLNMISSFYDEGFYAPVRKGILKKVESASKKIEKYFLKIVKHRVRKPQPDLATDLLRARYRNSRLSIREIADILFLLLFTSYKTTSLLVENTFLALAKFPKIQQKVGQNTQKIDSLIEETLRFYTPFQIATRYTTRSVNLNGTKIPSKATLILWLSSANRDEKMFKSPEQFQLDRKQKSHLAFSAGPHACLGQALARLVTKVTVEEFIKILKNVRLADSKNFQMLPKVSLFGPKHLHLIFRAQKKNNSL